MTPGPVLRSHSVRYGPGVADVSAGCGGRLWALLFAALAPVAGAVSSVGAAIEADGMNSADEFKVAGSTASIKYALTARGRRHALVRAERLRTSPGGAAGQNDGSRRSRLAALPRREAFPDGGHSRFAALEEAALLNADSVEASGADKSSSTIANLAENDDEEIKKLTAVANLACIILLVITLGAAAAARGGPPEKVSQGQAPIPVVVEGAEKQNPSAKLYAVLQIQAMYRTWKKNKKVTAAMAHKGPRALKPGQSVCLLIDVVSGRELPSVKTLGGVDPMVELRTLRSKQNPLKLGKAATEMKVDASRMVQTTAKGDANPIWNENGFVLKGSAYRPDDYLHIILWNYNLVGNSVIGHNVLTIQEVCEGLTYDAQANEPTQRSYDAVMKNLLNSDAENLSATLALTFAYVEVHKYRVKVVKASRLPKVDMLGTCDSVIEVRLVRGDPRGVQYEYRPGETCLWSGRTGVVANNMDPKYGKDFSFNASAFHENTLQFILIDDNTPLPEVVLGHACLDVKGILEKPPGKDTVDFKLKFKKIPGVDTSADISKSSLSVKVGYEIAFDEK